MFGLLRVPKGFLTATEYQIFQAHYCGICHALGRCGFQGLRMATSYDGAALAMFATAMSGVPNQIEQSPCPFAPWRKKYVLVNQVELLDFAASASLAVVGIKLEDVVLDEQLGLIKGWLYRVLRSYLQGKLPAWPELNRITALQQQAEQRDDPWFDELSLPSGLLIGSIGARAADLNEVDRHQAYLVGENLGKWIYTWDCLWDYPDDLSTGRFNGLAAAYNLQGSPIHTWDTSILAEMDFVLERSLTEILRNLELLRLGQNGQILAKLLQGAHNWHKQAFVKEFFKEGDYERLPSTWRPTAQYKDTQANSTGMGSPY